MTIAVLSCTVTAKAEQIPKICFEIGLALHRDSTNALYDFVYAKLVEGNLEKTDQPFSEALEIALELRETWKEAMALV